MRVSPLEAEMHQVRRWYLEALKHQERLNDIKKGMRDVFRGSKTLRKTMPMHLEVKLKKAKIDWWV